MSFHAALDVFEHEPRLTLGLVELDNVVTLPHLGSATGWTRRAMATLAAANVIGVLSGWPVSAGEVTPFLSPEPPRAAPSIVNAAALRLPVLEGERLTSRRRTICRRDPGRACGRCSRRP